MGKYEDQQSDIFSIFADATWKAEGIKTIPQNFPATNIGNEYVRVSVLSNKGINQLSTRGLLMIDIFVPSNVGPARVNQIADKLDDFISMKSITTGAGMTQFSQSSLNSGDKDRDNPSLFKATYSLTFNHYGVL